MNDATRDAVETAVRHLRRFVRNRLLIAFLPVIGIGLLIAGTVAYEWSRDTDDPASALYAFFGLVPFILFLTVPMLMGPFRPKLRAVLGYPRDVAAGLHVETAEGDVVWSRFGACPIARVDGRRLVSPFFTHVSDNAHFHHSFDLLTTGRYTFRYLRESGIAIEAEPLKADGAALAPVPGGYRDAGLQRVGDPSDAPRAVDLRRVFKVSIEDLERNRRGRLSLKQQFRDMLLALLWILPMNLFFAGTLVFQLSEMIEGGEDVGWKQWFGYAMWGLVAVGGAWFSSLTFLDLLIGRVHVIEGKGRASRGRQATRVYIGAANLETSHRRGAALSPSEYCVFYFLPRTGRIVAVEPIDDPSDVSG